MSTLPTGTVTFLFTDLEGSTRLWENHPDAMRVDLARHDALLRGAITAGGGHIFKTTGDAFCAAFATAPAGLRAALEAQHALHAESWEIGAPGLRARMALHTGEAQERDGDYFGRTLNRTGRLRDVAHGGQTVLSQATELLVRDALPADASLRDLGPHRLLDLSRPEQVFQLHHPFLPEDFPPLQSLDRFPNNLPQRLDSFVGRENDLASVKRLLPTTRLLTLTGVGGAGKTRLSQQAAAESLDRYPDGVWLVALEALSDPALVPQAVAAAVGTREQPGQALAATLCQALQTRRLLLLLDNCEHLITACAHLAQSLLQACPHMQILATSREPLAISGEATFAVPTLPQASASRPGMSGEAAEPSEAVRLFVERATLSLSSFTLTAQNAPAVARICRQLDGLPLAIELAAPRVKMLTPDQISQRLDNRFRLLTGGSRTALPRQQTMQAAIQWSHDLLSEPERLLFRRLSVFAGGWTLEAAEQVCSGDGLDEWDVMERLSSLVAKSLVQSDEDDGGEHRYRMLETLRQYSWEQLLASPGFGTVRERHRDWFLGLAERAETELRGPRQSVWLDSLEAEHDNFRAALTWSEPETRLRLTAALQRFWLTRGYLGEGRSWLEEASPGVRPVVAAKALNVAGSLAWGQADYEKARALHERSLALYQESKDSRGVAEALRHLGVVADFQGRHPDARRHLEESLRLSRLSDDRWNIAAAQLNLGSHFLDQNDAESAVVHLEQARYSWQILDDPWGSALALYNLGLASYQNRQWTQARAHLLRCVSIRRDLGDQRGVAAALFYLACADQAAGHDRRAAILLASAEAMIRRLDMPFHSHEQRLREDVTASLRASLGNETYAGLRTAGEQTSLEQTLGLAETQGSDEPDTIRDKGESPCATIETP